MARKNKHDHHGSLSERDWVVEMIRFYLDADPVGPVEVYEVPSDRFKIYAAQDGSASQYWVFANGDVEETSFAQFPPEFRKIK